MNDIFDWIKNNAHWIFDGIGVLLISGILGLIFKKKQDASKSIKIVQKNGKGSINIQNNSIGSENDE